MENKNKIKKSKMKKETKEKIFKIIHLFTYILSALFIIICIAVGVNSCKGNNKQSNKLPNNAVIENNTINLSVNDFTNYDFIYYFGEYLYDYNSNYINSFNSCPFTISGVIRTTNGSTSNTNSVTFSTCKISSYYGNGAPYMIQFYDNNYYFTIYPVWGYASVEYDCPRLEYRGLPLIGCTINVTNYDNDFLTLVNTYLVPSEGGYTEEEVEEMTSQAYDSGYNEGYSEGYNEGYSEGNEEGYSNGFNSGYQYAENIYNTDLEEIVINYDYDFRSLVCTNIDNKTGAMYSNTAYPQGQGAVINDLEGLTFMCNSQTYNFVRIAYMPLDRDDALFFEDDISVRTAYQLFGEQFIYYAKLLNVYYGFKDSEGNITQIDNAYNGITFQRGYDSNTLDVLGQDLRNPKFLNNSFRYLKIIEDTGELVSVKGYGNNYTLAQILSFDGQINTMNENTTNVFSLFSMAFGSMSGLLSIAILPNISLGLLMFIPLIVGIVVLILKAIKK